MQLCLGRLHRAAHSPVVLPAAVQHFMPAALPGAQGNWSATTCSCRCINQASQSLPGFCPDATTGACTVVKQYDLATGTWTCAGQVQGGDTSVSPSPSPSPTSSPAATSPSPSPSPAASSPATVTDSSLDQVADVQPLGGVQLTFVATGGVSAFASKAEGVCSVVAALAGEAPPTCSIVAVVEATAPAPGTATSTRRLTSAGENVQQGGVPELHARRCLPDCSTALHIRCPHQTRHSLPASMHADYIRVTLAIQPTAASAAQVASSLQAALQDGRLAAALAMVGVQLASSSTTAVQVVSAAVPSNNKTAVGLGVGIGVGGAALLCIGAAVFLVLRRRRRQAVGAGHRRDELPVSAFLGHEEANGKAKVGRLKRVGVRRAADHDALQGSGGMAGWGLTWHALPAGLPAPQGSEPDCQGGTGQQAPGPRLCLRQHAPQHRHPPPPPPRCLQRRRCTRP